MIKRTWLLLDMSNLAYRALHSTGDLSHGGEPTGVLYGIFRDIINFQDMYSTNKLIFCFDHGISYRWNVFNGYKRQRRERDAKLEGPERDAKDGMRAQLNALRETHLKSIGFKNILWDYGIEADDIMASVVRELPEGDAAILVSSDKDLYQLLQKGRVAIYNPHSKKHITQTSFEAEWGISARLWHKVKAIAGCETDEIPGLAGVAEPTAIKYLNGELPEHYKTYTTIVTMEEVWKANLRLVQLPFEGTPKYKIIDDNMDLRAWDRLATTLGMASLVQDKSWAGIGVNRKREQEHGLCGD